MDLRLFSWSIEGEWNDGTPKMINLKWMIPLFMAIQVHSWTHEYEYSLQNLNGGTRNSIITKFGLGTAKNIDFNARVVLFELGQLNVNERNCTGTDDACFNSESTAGFSAWGAGLQGKYGNQLKIGSFLDYILEISPMSREFDFAKAGIFGEYWFKNLYIGPVISYSKTRSNTIYQESRITQSITNIDGMGYGVNFGFKSDGNTWTGIMDGVLYSVFILSTLFGFVAPKGP